MLSRSLLARSSPLGLSATLTTRVCSRSLSTLRLAQPARRAVPSRASLRRFSDAPGPRTEDPVEVKTPRPPSGTCFVANIPFRITARQLHEVFSEFGKVESVRLLTTEAGLSRGVCFVHFKTPEDSVRLFDAHVADPIFLLDRQIYVEHALRETMVSKSLEPTDTLQLLDVSQGQVEDDIRLMFGNHGDRILAVRFNKKDPNQTARKAFVQFRNADIATEAMDEFKERNQHTGIVFARHRQFSNGSAPISTRLSQRQEH